MTMERKMLHAFEMKLRKQRRETAGHTQLEKRIAERKGAAHHGHFAAAPKGKRRNQSPAPRSSIWPQSKSVAPCRQLNCC